MSFVNVQITTDPDQMLDQAIDQINSTLAANGYPGWSPADAALAVIVLAAVAQIAADVAQVAATVLPAVFRAFGTQIMGIPYENGATASVLSTWTFTNPAPQGGYLIPGGTAVIVGGEVFYTQVDYQSAQGDTSAVIMLIASQSGSSYNGLGGVNEPAVLNQGIDWVAGVVTQGLSSDGADPETDTEYQNKLVSEAQLQAPRPVVNSDFAAMLLSDLAATQTGVVVGRATSIDGYYPDGRALSTGGAGSTALACQLTSGSTTVEYAGNGIQAPEIGAEVTGTGVPAGATVAATPAPTASTFTLTQAATVTGAETLTVDAMTGYGPEHLTCQAALTSGSESVTVGTPPYTGAIPDIGARVTGTGVPAGATVAATPAPTTNSFTLSEAATATGAETLTISSWTSVALADCSFVTDVNGNALSAADLDALESWLERYRPQNWLVNVTSPSYTTIYLTCLVKVLPTFDQSAVAQGVQSALLSWLSPATWGNPLGTTTGADEWLNATQGFNIVRYKKAIEVAGSVPGVDYVDTLTLDTAPEPTATADIEMAGPAPLPEATVSTITVTTE